MIAAVSSTIPLRPCAAPRPASPRSLLATAGASVGTGIGAAAIASAVGTAGEFAALPAASAILDGYAPLGGLFGTLDFLVMAQGGATLALAGAAAAGLAVGALAARSAPIHPGRIRRFLERPAGALRQAGPDIAAAANRSAAARAGARAGYAAGAWLGGLAGGLDGAATGYGLGVLAAGLFTASAPLAIATAVAGAAVGAGVLGAAGHFMGGAMGAGVGALGGAVLYNPTP